MGQVLDPQKAFSYGQFVQAAYTMFLDPRGGDPLRPEPAGIPDGYELGAWIHMSDFILNVEEPKFYGIVVHGIEDPDSRIIAIRGTEHLIEWLDDAFAILIPFRQVPSAGRVAAGFDKIYSTLKVVKRTLPGEAAPTAALAPLPETFEGSFAEQLDKLAAVRETARGVVPSVTAGAGRRHRPTVVTGHSLGAALTTLFVMENDSKDKFDLTTSCTFASPRVGNQEFARRFDQLPIDSWRIVNTLDLVPKLPPSIPMVLDYDHVNTAYPFSSVGFARNSLVCWHSLASYLHSLDASYAVITECKL